MNIEETILSQEQMGFIKRNTGYSVTTRAQTVLQPKGGYLPKEIFQKIMISNVFDVVNGRYKDSVDDIVQIPSIFAARVGNIVDYMTRFLIGRPKEEAFRISLNGAYLCEGYQPYNVEELLDNITGNNIKSIENAILLGGYDGIYRNDIVSYNQPSMLPKEIIEKMMILIDRSIFFFSDKNVLETGTGVSLGGGTLSIAGELDYLTASSLIDMKISSTQFSIIWSLQVLMYWIMGLHSFNERMGHINTLGIYNPIYNTYQQCRIQDIPVETLYKVSKDVIGYKMLSDDPRQWMNVKSYDVMVALKDNKKRYLKTNFKIENYQNGIFDISQDDYWTFLQDHAYAYKGYAPIRPNFKYTKRIKLIKRNNYYMFLAERVNGGISILKKAAFQTATHDAEYYYEHLEEYAEKALKIYRPYYKSLQSLMKIVDDMTEYSIKQGTYFSQPFWNIGRPSIHGAIVNLDALNHLFLNPIDGSITPYFATSIVEKTRYENLVSLLTEKKEALLPAWKELMKDNKHLPVLTNNLPKNAISVIIDPNANKNGEYVPETTIYKYSTIILNLQCIQEHGWIVQWLDSIMNHGILQITTEKTHKIRQIQRDKHIGEKKQMKCGMNAEIIDYKKSKDVTVKFDDGTIKHVTYNNYKKGAVKNKNMQTQVNFTKRVSKDSKSQIKELQRIGEKRIMNCGVSAEIIEYENHKNITIRFEDGLIRKCRYDKFKEGKVAHIKSPE